MNRELLSQALSGIDERHIASAARFDPKGIYASPERQEDMFEKVYARRKTRQIIALAAAAAIILALGITAYAAGWIPSIFGDAAKKYDNMEEMERVERMKAAAEAVAEDTPTPETAEIPAMDGSSLTLLESYYDGSGLLLGVDLNAIVPAPVIGYAPDAELLEAIRQPNQRAFVYISGEDDIAVLRQSLEESDLSEEDYAAMTAQLDAQERLIATGDPDDLNHCLSSGYIDQASYDETMAMRTDRGAENDLHYESAICLERYLAETLSEEEYEQLWSELTENGHVCVAVTDAYIGDHILMDDGTDLGFTNQDEMDGGLFIEAYDLPDAARGLDELRIQLKVKSGLVYYYMELNGLAWAYHTQPSEQLVSFTILRSD